jgi:hypothetical protein
MRETQTTDSRQRSRGIRSPLHRPRRPQLRCWMRGSSRRGPVTVVETGVGGTERGKVNAGCMGWAQWVPHPPSTVQTWDCVQCHGHNCSSTILPNVSWLLVYSRSGGARAKCGNNGAYAAEVSSRGPWTACSLLLQVPYEVHISCVKSYKCTESP